MKIKYHADDGTVFDTEEDCLAYEAKGIRVRDGVVLPDMSCWWRSEEGPVPFVFNARGEKEHRENMRVHPDAYSLKEPRFKVVYED